MIKPYRQNIYLQEIIEVLLSWDDPISAIGYAKQAGGGAWGALAPRKLLGAARRAGAPAFVAVCHALFARNERQRGAPHFLKGEYPPTPTPSCIYLHV